MWQLFCIQITAFNGSTSPGMDMLRGSRMSGKGMQKFVVAFDEKLEKDGDGVAAKPGERVVARKLPDAVLKRRREQRLLGILDSDQERNTFQPAPANRRELVTELRGKQSRIEKELENWYRFRSPHSIDNPPGVLDGEVQKFIRQRLSLPHEACS